MIQAQEQRPGAHFPESQTGLRRSLSNEVQRGTQIWRQWYVRETLGGPAAAPIQLPVRGVAFYTIPHLDQWPTAGTPCPDPSTNGWFVFVGDYPGAGLPLATAVAAVGIAYSYRNGVSVPFEHPMLVEQPFEALTLTKLGGGVAGYHFHLLVLLDTQRRGRDVAPGR